MGSSTKVGKDASLADGGVFFQTYRDLLKQREALDRQIMRLQGRFFKMVKKNTTIKGKLPISKRYVARMQNHTILADAIRGCMVPGKKMGMQDVLCSLRKSGAYRTQSSYFYTMVNNKLNRDRKIKKISRGVFILQKKRKRKKTGRSRKRVA